MNRLEELIDSSKKGYLRKKGLILWSKRYIILHRNKPLITYLISQNSPTARGIIVIENSSVLQCDKELDMPFTFKIIHPSKKPLYFQASSEEERKEWMSALIQEIEGGLRYADPIDTPPSAIIVDEFGEWVNVGNNPIVISQEKSVTNRIDNDISIEKIKVLFYAYADKETDAITTNGIIKLCHDIELNDEDVIMLILSFNLNSTKFGKFTRIDFLSGMESLRIDNIISLKEAIVRMKLDFDNNIETLRKVYLFSFQLAAQERKILSTDVAIALLKVLLRDRYKLVPYFCDYLIMQLQNHKLSYITKDQWICFLEMCINIKEDLSNYLPSDEWPTLLDEFIEWLKTKRE